jgi:hypothetical protein
VKVPRYCNVFNFDPTFLCTILNLMRVLRPSRLEGGGITDLWSVGILPQHHTMSEPRRPQLETLWTWMWLVTWSLTLPCSYKVTFIFSLIENSGQLFILFQIIYMFKNYYYFFHHRFQTGSGARPASHPKGTGALSLGIKRSGREADH